MQEPGIVFDNVWKKFRRGELHDSLRDFIPAVTRRLVRRDPPDDTRLEEREFWALRDVSFEVRPGQALGIIGANGAGKSTVLKILNRILRPTRGHVAVRGRAGALIEISAGFHLDLTGRENVYLQGSIMGMRKVEIDRKFDQIVEFSGVSDFIDTPVKRYSSGMNARLGFSIAAHLDPDILIIDEVLAVGDFTFQDKAFGRIRDLVRSGIPVVIVSHQLERIASLCTDALVLDHGQVVERGTPAECIAAYVRRSEEAPVVNDDAPAWIEEAMLVGAQPVASGERVMLRISGSMRPGAAEKYDPFHIRLRSAQTGEVVYSASGTLYGLQVPGEGPFTAEIDLQLNVPAGVYRLETAIQDRINHTDVGRGPTVYLQVVDSTPFQGHTQLNAVMRQVTPPHAEGTGGDGAPSEAALAPAHGA